MSSEKILGFALIFLTILFQRCSTFPTDEDENLISPIESPEPSDYSGFISGDDRTEIVEDFRQPRIVNGRNARPNEFPHQVAILFRNGPVYSYTCAGSIYNKKFILTAGHCLQGATGSQLTPQNLRVIAGVLEVGIIVPANSRMLMNVSRVVIHRDFDGNLTPLLLNDIGIIELATPLNYTTSIKKIRVAQPNEAINAAGVADVVGWGRTEVHLPSGQPLGGEQPLQNPLVLRTARLRVIPRQLCTVRYFIIVPETLLCVGSEGLLDSQSACYGDSGGPLLCQGPSGMYLCGIVSIGPGCGLRLTPAFYTDVSKFNTWITGIAGQQY